MTLQFDPNREEFESFLDVQLGLVGLQCADLSAEVTSVYPLIERQFAAIRNKYFRNDDGPTLRVAHNAQYTIFLYHLSRVAFAADRRLVADRIYTLLRMVSSVDLYYEIDLPGLWGCDHPLGSVIGRGEFSSDATLFFTQNCNIGNNRGIFPMIAGNLHMLPNSTLVGHTRISGNVVLANGTYVVDVGELADCFVFGRSPDLVIRPLSANRFRELSHFELNL